MQNGKNASCVILASVLLPPSKLELPPSMSPFVLSLLAAALAASGGDAFAVVPRPASSSAKITCTTSTLFAENNVADEQPTRRDVFRTLAAGAVAAATAIPSAALANVVVDTDEFGQEVEYDDEEQPSDKSDKGEKN